MLIQRQWFALRLVDYQDNSKLKGTLWNSPPPVELWSALYEFVPRYSMDLQVAVMHQEIQQCTGKRREEETRCKQCKILKDPLQRCTVLRYKKILCLEQ